MLTHFKTYQLAIQLMRSSSSIALNIAEGSGKLTHPDKRRFYAIALGSLRESMAALELRGEIPSHLANTADQLGACLYRLCHPK